MSTKRKGIRAERELSHLFWANEWATCRAAGSGSTPHPNPDLLASNGNRVLAIECKSIKKDKKYLTTKDVDELTIFSKKFGAEPWIGIRFDSIGWYFLRLEDLEKSKKGNYAIPLDLAKKKGLAFKELIGLYKQERLN